VTSDDPGGVPGEVLSEAEVARWCAVAGLSEPSTRALTGLAAGLPDEPELLAAVGDLYRTLYCTAEDPNPAMARVTALAGERAGTVNALLILLSIPLVTARQQARGVPPDLTRAVNDRHGIGWLRSLDDPGPVSVTDWHPLWFRTVASGRLYRAGRLEFEPIGFKHPFEAWRSAAGTTVLVACDGVRLSADGFLTGEPTWTARSQERDGVLTANPVLPTGEVRREPVRLPLAGWRRVLAPGGPLLDLHVPHGTDLDPDVLRDALERAWALNAEFEPDHHPVGFVCASWLFCPQLPEILGEPGRPATGRDSKILRWHEEGYLFPDAAGDGSFLNWAFGARTIDPAVAPRDTRLRRGALRRLAAGLPLRSGGWLLLAADRPRFGQRPYRESSTAAAFVPLSPP
jgi:hypothetical protein